MSFIKQQEEMISSCKRLLEDELVETVVGFGEGGELGKSLPLIVSDVAGAEKLVWNERCVPTLNGYLLGRTGKTAIVAKPCDARAVVSLIRENQLKREDVYIVGLVCEGMTDDNGKPLHGCLDCRVKTPPVYDTLIGGPEPDGNIGIPEKGPDTSDANFERFIGEMEKCILCFSCRQSCYGCYCKTCFIDRGEPNWQPATPDTGAKMLYHLGRAMHLSGRCVECGSCENACASGVDIRYLIKNVTNFIDDTYGYRAGMDLETEPVMLTFKTDDREIGFLKLGGDADA